MGEGGEITMLIQFYHTPAGSRDKIYLAHYSFLINPSFYQAFFYLVFF